MPGGLSNLSLDNPVHSLDPLTPTHVEGPLLTRHGPIVPVSLSDGVRAWVAVDNRASRIVLEAHPHLSKNPVHWGAYQRGEVPSGWPLLSLIVSDSMLNTDGVDHMRLRRLVSFAFTPGRVRALTPRIGQISHDLLDTMAATAAGRAIDLKENYAFPLPMQVICELFGITDPEMQRSLRNHYTTMLGADAVLAERHAAAIGVKETMRQVVVERRVAPRDDLTSALTVILDEQGDRYSEQELVDTLEILLLAGHETTVQAITNTVHALLTHPEQLDRVRSGARSWSDAVEAGLRWNGPLRSLYMRYATRDVGICGVTVREGEPILVALATANRDTDGHPTADRFDVDRANKAHIAFGAGPHFCIGAPLARLEAETALRELFARFPNLALAVPEGGLDPLVSAAINGLTALPVELGS
jgi:hypothetical protein